MGIFGFLFGLGCLVLIAWAIALLGDLLFGRKHRQQNRPQEQPLPKPTQFRERFGSSQPPIATPPTPTAPRRRIVAPQEQPSPKPTQFRERFGSSQPPTPTAPHRRVVTLRQPPVSSRVRQTSNRHQQYIQLADSVLKRLRDAFGGSRSEHRITVIQLPEALAILRKMNPYAFEELLLTCCHERGWKIERNFKYSNDGGLDGRVTIAGKLYLIQAKRYRGYINPKHIHDFHRVIRGEEAVGGFFIHTGRTSELSKELLREYGISLLSGQRLVDFVLGKKLKVLG